MEVAQEGEKEMKMVLHCPLIYPLPEEIKKVGSDSEIMFLKSPGRYLPDCFYLKLYPNTRGTNMKSFSAQTCIQFGNRTVHVTFQSNMLMKDHIDTTYVLFLFFYNPEIQMC